MMRLDNQRDQILYTFLQQIGLSAAEAESLIDSTDEPSAMDGVLAKLPQIDMDQTPDSAWEDFAAGWWHIESRYDNRGKKANPHLFDALYRLGGPALFDRLFPAIGHHWIYVLQVLFEKDPGTYTRHLVEHIGHPSSVVRDTLIELLHDCRAADDAVLAALASTDRAHREHAVQIIANWNDDRTVPLLKEAYEREENDPLKRAIHRLLGLVSEEVVGAMLSNEPLTRTDQLPEHCSRILKRYRRPHLLAFAPDTLPSVRYKDSDEVVQEKVRTCLLTLYAEHPVCEPNSEADEIAAFLREDDLSDLVIELLTRWWETGADMEKKWALLPAARHSAAQAVEPMKGMITSLSQNGQAKVAAEVVRALAFTGEQEALVFVDWLSRTSKSKRVMAAASESIAAAARARGLEPEELSDQLVPDFGFDENGEMRLNYGARFFTVRLVSGLQLELFDAKGKQVKSLPKPGQKDDEAKGLAARETLNALKKSLKTFAAVQTARMENARTTGRTWTQEAWQALFKEHPVMRQFGGQLLFGVYQDGQLVQTEISESITPEQRIGLL